MEVLRKAGLRLGSGEVVMGEGEVVRRVRHGVRQKAKGASLQGVRVLCPQCQTGHTEGRAHLDTVIFWKYCRFGSR